MSLYKIDAETAKYLKSTAEHLIAQQDGGTDSEENIAAACLWCNGKRHSNSKEKALSPAMYRQQVRRLVAKSHWHPAATVLRYNYALPVSGSNLIGIDQ